MAWVVKLGGSLIKSVDGIIDEIRSSGVPVLIVPGGGPFADLVRAFDVDENAAHWMAIAAMDQFGWYISSRGVRPVVELIKPEGISVLLPYTLMRARDPLPRQWEVTSDTISAWVAYTLGLPLLLLKYKDYVTEQGRQLDRITAAIACSDLDPTFIPYVLSRGMTVMVISGLRRGRIAEVLKGGKVPGTVIGPIF
jgi:aspartokinase-like uncharacterized kinase